MSASPLRVQRRGRAAVLTFERPDDGNLLNFAMLTALRAAMADAGADDGVDVVILTGAGPCFCIGDDGADIMSADAEVARTINQAIFRDAHVWTPIAKPVIGAINGRCERGGLEVALQCDFLIASDRATFRDAHVIDGVVPAWALTATLPSAVGRGLAIQMILTGRAIDAGQALTAGLVTAVVEHDDLLDEAMRVAADISAADQPAVRNVLATMRAGGPLSDERLLALEFEAHRALLTEEGRFPSVRAVLDDVASARRAAG